MVNLALIGAGRIGRLHAQNLSHRVPGARLVTVSDVVSDAAQTCAALCGCAVADLEQIWQDDRIDAVVICSSTDTHAGLIEQAAAAGKHIFCEKPIALDLNRIDHALQAVQDAGVKLQVGFNRRFDPNFRRVRELVTEGKIGTPHLLRITSRDPAPPPIGYVQVSGGIFLDMMIHDLDMARYLMGREVVEVFATGSVLVDPAIGEAGDVDTAVVVLHFDGGAIGTIDNSRRAVYGYDQRVEVFGSAGMVAADNNTADRTVYSTAEGVHSALPLYFFVERYAEAYVAEMEAFIRSIDQDTPPPVTGLDGRIPVAIARAAQRSLQEHRPVRLVEVDPSSSTGGT